MRGSSNETSNECFITVPVLFLIGEKHVLLVNIAANVFLMLTASLGNLSILLSFLHVPSLRTTSNYLLCGLALTDLGVGLVVHPLYISVMYSLYNNTTPHCIINSVYSIATSFFAGVSLLYITVIGTDRYLAITLNLRYHEFVTERKTKITQVVLWSVSGLMTLVWLEGFLIYSNVAAAFVGISLVVTFAVYTKLYFVVRRHKSQIQNQIPTQIYDFENVRLRRLQRSAINTLCIFFIFLLCYLPFFVFTAMGNLSSSPKKKMVIVYEYTTTLMLFNSSINPLMYCFRLLEFRNALKTTFKRTFCLHSSHE
ncbi:octopamine receptor beta-1R-like [Montipora capricornis]|uniref:octopamine receptor beta-1R-like n=1 Tax=Montipora capricornis TaxID=246305 RepID=UPI0035F119FE